MGSIVQHSNLDLLTEVKKDKGSNEAMLGGNNRGMLFKVTFYRDIQTLGSFSFKNLATHFYSLETSDNCLVSLSLGFLVVTLQPLSRC